MSHDPERPGWNCDTCGDPWPCKNRREGMIAVAEPVVLALMMAGWFAQACEDLPMCEAGALHRRFLGWIRDGQPKADPMPPIGAPWS